MEIISIVLSVILILEMSAIVGYIVKSKKNNDNSTTQLNETAKMIKKIHLLSLTCNQYG